MAIVKTEIRKAVLGALVGLCAVTQAFAQGTAFTYQGRLNDNGAPASGIYELRFTIYDSASGGNAVAAQVTGTGVPVANGLFTVTLDFGANVFTGPGRWLEIGVRTNGGASFVSLIPRQPLTPAPYAIFAATASNVVAGSVVKSVNALKDEVTIAAGSNVTITPVGNTLTIAVPTGGSSNWVASGPDTYIPSGNVGIGTATPATKLTVQTAVGQYGVEHTDGARRLSTYVSGTGGWLGTRSGDPLHFFVNDGAASMTVAATGNVGIGTADPVSKLHVAGDAFLSGNANFGNATRQMLNLFGTGFGFGIQPAILYSRSGAGFAWYAGGAHNDTSYDSGGGTTLMTLDATRGLDFGSRLGQHLSLWGSDGSRRFGVGIQGGTLYSRAGGSAGDGFAWHKGGVHNDNPGDPGGGTTLMRLNEENGLAGLSKVGIGTPAPAHKLHVAGEGPSGYAIGIEGNATQNRDKGGWVKAMAKVNADGTIARQFSAFPGTITAAYQSSGRSYTVIFPFQINDRFVSVTPLRNGSVGNVAATVTVGGPLVSNQAFVFVTSLLDPALGEEPELANEFFIFVF